MTPDFGRRLRTRQALLGYWMASDNPPAAERLAATGYDYLVLDRQHGFIDSLASLRGLIAVDAGAAAGGTSTVGVVRVPSNTVADIGRALDAGALGVIVPLVNTPEEAEAAVRACRYPPTGIRSFGPTRSNLRVGPDLAEANEAVGCIVMIETGVGLANAEAICRVPGIDAVYIGPSDLSIGIGAANPAEGWATPAFAEAKDRIKAAAAAAGIGCGLHCRSGADAGDALNDGFTFSTVSNDLTHLEVLAQQHLAEARKAVPSS